jgi:hypothetical protein
MTWEEVRLVRLAAADAHALHDDVLSKIEDHFCAVQAAEETIYEIARLHKPELFGGVVACLACSPGMPPPVLVEWRSCATIALVVKGLELDVGKIDSE